MLILLRFPQMTFRFPLAARRLLSRSPGAIRALALSASLCACAAFAPPGGCLAQATGKTVVKSEADLPRFNYALTGSATALLQSDDATFGAFAAEVRVDVDSVLTGYDIEDHATLRDLLMPLLCPACGGSMKVLAFITDPPVLSAILLHLDLPHRPPPLAPARGPPQRDFMLDQTSSYDPADPDPVPAFQFDQSLPANFDD